MLPLRNVINCQRFGGQLIKRATASYDSLHLKQQVRWKRHPGQPHLYTDFYRRRLEAGPEPERPRSAALEWNYDSELHCFGIRLGEEFNQRTLNKAFRFSSYVQEQQEKALADAETLSKLDDNTELINAGNEHLERFVKAYIRHHFPNMPEQCVCSLYEWLCSTSMLSYVATHLGMRDLIRTTEFPPTEETLAETFKAVVGALETDQGAPRADKFVQDFLMTQLVGRDINELLGIVNPMGLLTQLLADMNAAPPEPRLIFATGTRTVTASYMVGVYSDKKLIGKSYGETALLAEEMAARDALSNVFGTTCHRAPLTSRHPVRLSPQNYQPNQSVSPHFS